MSSRVMLAAHTASLMPAAECAWKLVLQLRTGCEIACKSAPLAIIALAVGWCVAQDLRGSGYVGPRDVPGT